MDQCRVSWGKIVSSSKIEVRSKSAKIILNVRPLIYEKDKLKLGKSESKEVISLGLAPKIGEWVSVHWGYICEILTLQQVKNLEHYTKLAIYLANRSV